MVRQPIFPTREADPSAGFLLIDMAMAMSILLVVALVAWPALLQRSSRPKIASVVQATAATLRSARAAAGLGGRPVAVTFDLGARRVSLDHGRTTQFPADVSVDLTTDLRCRRDFGVFVLDFLPDGRSCGGVFKVWKGDLAWNVEINWLTGAVHVSGPGQT